VRVERLLLRDFRNYEAATVELGAGVTIVHGPVGAGKTNLLEALHFGCLGRSCRTANERELVRFGANATYVRVTGENDRGPHTFEVGLAPGRSKSMKVDGTPWSGSGERDERPLVCVFMPDRLELVKGAAAVRRTHLDTLVSAIWPARRATRAAYAKALAQRNALVSRVRAGAAADSLVGWTRELASHGIELMRDRSSAVELLSATFPGRARELGLEGEAAVEYRPRSRASTPGELETEMTDALAQDLARGFSTHGPHRDDLRFSLHGRELRRFGSQGQQRLALLAALLSERDALERTRGDLPILLLDDVLSELDTARRERLLELLVRGGQAMITTADPGAVASRPDGITELRVEAGAVDV
jgi:DNA replication and repair protein RecF